MAEVVLCIVKERLTNLVLNEGNLLFEVSDEAEEAKSKLQRMHCFLKDADERARHGDKTF